MLSTLNPAPPGAPPIAPGGLARGDALAVRASRRACHDCTRGG